MPNFDKTGPQGQGPKTGRGMGNCDNNFAQQNVGFFGRVFGRGRGRGNGQGFGRGRGRGNGQGFGRNSN